MIEGLRKPVSFHQKSKVVIIGSGNVGEAIAYTLMVRKQANDIVLIDVDEPKAKAASLDIAHGTGFYRQVWVRTGTYEDCKDAQMIIITAGVGRKPGQSRLDLGSINVKIARDIARNIIKYNDNPIIVVVSNPADVVTAAVLEETGLRRGQVIGSGTSLDTARFRYFISSALHVDVEDIKAYVLGEHGDSQVPIWSNVTIAGIPLDVYESQTGIKIDRDEIASITKTSGADIIKGKGATFYGVSMAVSNITERIMNDQQGVVPVAHLMGARYGKWANVCFSMPCIIGSDGIEKTFNIPLSPEEEDALDRSVEIIRDMQNQLGIFTNLTGSLE
ncbi:L-lactate dehydrogenase [Ruminococcaceae bacterium YRB3002]|nr:L-lactate dehydrogenase [Ruminococcaceae bacterium YRB3002]